MFSNIKNKIKEMQSNSKTFLITKFKNLKSFIYKKFEKPIKFVQSKMIEVKKLLQKIATKLHLPEFCKKTRLDKFYNFLKRIINVQLLKKLFLLIVIPFIIYLFCQFLCNGKFIFFFF